MPGHSSDEIPMSSSEEGPVEQEIARQLLAIHEDSYGASAERVRVVICEDTVFVILDGLELQRQSRRRFRSPSPPSVRKKRVPTVSQTGVTLGHLRASNRMRKRVSKRGSFVQG